MTPAFVIDCSITMAWCFADEATAAASKVQDRLEGEATIVPAHWFLEVTNVLTIAERRKRIDASISTRFLELLETMEIVVDVEAPGRAFTDLMRLCRAHGLTSYDAAYLELSTRRRLPLATLDADLRSAAKRLDIRLLGK